MALVFFRTAALDDVVSFYTDRVGCRVWHEQPDCTILEHVGSRVGFCETDGAGDGGNGGPDTCGTLTFVYPTRAGVDAAHDRLADVADGDPRYNERYEIYQFFATDPEGRTVECQTFEHERERD